MQMASPAVFISLLLFVYSAMCYCYDMLHPARNTKFCTDQPQASIFLTNVKKLTSFGVQNLQVNIARHFQEDGLYCYFCQEGYAMSGVLFICLSVCLSAGYTKSYRWIWLKFSRKVSVLANLEVIRF